MTQPIVDRQFVEKFFNNVDYPLKFGVYTLINEWWETAPQEAIDAYAESLAKLPGATEFLAERYLAEPVTLESLENCEAGTLGQGYRSFIGDNNLFENLAVNYHTYYEELLAAGKLDRQPEDLRYAGLRGFQLHDILHVLTGHDPSPAGELGMAGFHYGQQFNPYHAMRTAVTTGHVAFVAPQYTQMAMDMLSRGWMMGRMTPNISFVKWEEEFNTPIEELRERYEIKILPMLAG